jgi:hypothetical protein
MAMASSVAASLRALAAAPAPAALPKPFLVLLSPALPRGLSLRSTRPRLPLAPLAASDSFFDSSVEVADPDVAEDEALEAVAEEEPAVVEEEEVAVEEEEVEVVGEYVEPPEEAKVYVGNLPYDVDSERLAQLFEQAGVVEVSEVSTTPLPLLFATPSLLPLPLLICPHDGRRRAYGWLVKAMPQIT